MDGVPWIATGLKAKTAAKTKMIILVFMFSPFDLPTETPVMLMDDK